MDMLKQFGEAGFREFQGKMRSEPRGKARHKLIEKVVVNGDNAVLEARDGPNVLSVAHLVRTKDGWKVGVRR